MLRTIMTSLRSINHHLYRHSDVNERVAEAYKSLFLRIENYLNDIFVNQQPTE